MTTILVVDDEEHFRNRLVKAMINRGYETRGAGDFQEAMAEIESWQPSMAVVDLKMPGKSGLELIKAAKARFPELKMVVLTGYGSIATAIEAVKFGALSYISKPADVDEILKAFTKAQDQEINLDSESLKAPSLARAEWEHINRVLEDCNGNISQAARRLGIHRRSLQRKLQKYPPKQ